MTATCHQAEIIRGDDIDITMAERRILTLGTRTNFLTQLHSSFQVWITMMRDSIWTILILDTMYFIPIKNEYVLPEKFIYLISIPIKVLSIRET